MTIMSDWEIKRRARKGMIEPFYDGSISVREDNPKERAISYGLSSYGYDARVADRFLVYHNALADYIDPKNFNEDSFVVVEGKGYVMVPANSFVLCETIEYFRIPRNCLPGVMAKSTYARAGLVTNATVLEPEWEGTITLELSNTTPLPIKVYANEGIVQIVFFKADIECEKSYADKKGKYQNQVGITPPHMGK